jgi:outer membrane protein assembly factor BamB
MLKRTALTILACAMMALTSAEAGSDWPAWRGPTRDGIAAPGQNPLVHWGENEGVLWKVAIPGRGHGSPSVVGERIYLATADPKKGSQSVLCLDRKNGKEIWATEVHGGNADPGHHGNSSAASSTVAWDGGQLFINFLNDGAVYTSALDEDGKILWQRKICDYVTHQGFAASPVVHESQVIVAADHRGGGVVSGLDRKSGRVMWTQKRPKIPNYTTPSIVRAGGKTQMVMAGCNLISSFDPVSGKKLWEMDGSTEECVTTAVTDGERVFFSGGWPRNHTVAVMADGSGQIAWQNNTRVYVPSMIAKDGYLYAVTDAGMAVCWKSDSGKEMWKERLGGDFYASPVMVGDRIYASNVNGKTYVYEATPKSFKLLAQNQLGNEAYASPAICGDRIYLRHARRDKSDNSRQEFLYCVGK